MATHTSVAQEVLVFGHEGCKVGADGGTLPLGHGVHTSQHTTLPLLPPRWSCSLVSRFVGCSLYKVCPAWTTERGSTTVGRLDGKIAIVTGASSGIGEGTAELFAKEGAAVVLTARRTDRLEALAEKIEKAGGRALAVTGDVRKVEDVKNVVVQTMATFGKVDVLVNNAGILDKHMPTIRCPDALWHDVIATDLTGVFYYCREVLPHMVAAGKGSIVNVSSIGGIYMSAGVPYSSAKAGVNGLTRNIALQYSGTGIRCNSVNPGPTPTEANTPEKLATFDQEFMEICAKHQFWAGESEVIDQAYAILFFASDESRYITGQWLVVDRGMNL